jgi:hypothetical protein
VADRVSVAKGRAVAVELRSGECPAMGGDTTVQQDSGASLGSRRRSAGRVVKETERVGSRGGHGHGSEMRRARGGCQQSRLNSVLS